MVSTAAGTSQRSLESTQTSLTVLKGRLPTKMSTPVPSTEERLCGADSMEVCPADTEESGEVASSSKPLKQSVQPPIPLGRGKGARRQVSAPGKGT
ncbi:hypothetical protein MTO96_028996 [Rhipicephalus appendiculatus]